MKRNRNTTKVAVVTGAASGIGLACVLRLVRDGYQVAAIDLTKAKLAGLVQEQRGKVVAFGCDLSIPSAVVKLVSRVRQTFDSVDVLINNAGSYLAKPIAETGPQDWRRSLDLNLVAPALLVAAFSPGMCERGHGAIVNVSSRNALMSSPRCSTYDASKAGLLAMTRSLALELGPSGVRVNAVCPGVTRTAMTASVLDQGDFNDNYLRLIPLRRFGDPADIAGVVAFLCSNDACFVTGQYIVTDGGQSCGQDYASMFKQ